MFLGIIPAVIGAVGAVASIASSLGGNGSGAQRDALETQIETEEKLYKLREDTRLWQQNEQAWQNTRERLMMQADKRSGILASRLRQRESRVNRLAQTGQIQSAAFQTDQERSLAEQSILQEEAGVGRQRQQLAAEGQQAISNIPGAGQFDTDSVNSLAMLEAAQLQRESILGQVNQQSSTMHAMMQQRAGHMSSLFDAQHQLQSGSLVAQQRLVNLQRQTTAAQEQNRRGQIRTTTRMNLAASRANQAANRALQRNMTQAERAEHEARIAQLQGAMPVSQNNIGQVIGSVAQGVAPLAGSLFARSGGGVQSQSQQQFRIDDRFNLGTFNQPLTPQPSFQGQVRVGGTSPLMFSNPETTFSGLPHTHSQVG